jgi:DNA-directed RNA polymerase subunit beta'
MLQEAVDAVFDNGRHGRAVTGAGGRPLKSLSDMLKGKTGRFRQNLLGKRVDYSGRSVIICGPDLKLWQCGLPKKMALVLFEPFIIRRLKERGYAHTVRSAKKLIERQDEAVWDVLDEVTHGKTVMLNRAPTLHRLSIQSFEPVLIEGEAIRLHPMVCTAFNADFDGDQMAVHVPLSVEAQLESRLLMLSSNSIFSPASGKSIMTPTQDIALGIYYLTAESQVDKMRRKNGLDKVRKETIPLFNDVNEVRLAYQDGAIKTHTRIRFKNADCGRDTKFGDQTNTVIETTVGRVFFNEVWPGSLGFINRAVDKSLLGDLIWWCHFLSGHDVTVRVLDDLKSLGFAQATLAGVSIGLVDMIVPQEKMTILGKAQGDVEEIRKQYRAGVITDGERHNKVVDVWFGADLALPARHQLAEIADHIAHRE